MIWLFIHLLLYFSTNCSFPFNIYIIQSCVMIHPLRNINTNFKQQRKFTVVFEQRWGQLNNKTRCILHLWYFFFLESNFEPYPSDNSWQAWLPHCSLFVTLAPGPLAHRLYLLVRWGLHKKKKMFSAILGRGPSHCCFDCEAFWCAGIKTQIGSPMADLHVGDQREGWKSKRLVRGLNPRQDPLQKRKESHSQSSVFLSDERVALPQSLFLLSPLQLTLAN